MTSILQDSARTTPRVRAELQTSKETASVLAERNALSRNLTLLTHSMHGFSRVPGLEVEDWLT